MCNNLLFLLNILQEWCLFTYMYILAQLVCTNAVHTLFNEYILYTFSKYVYLLNVLCTLYVSLRIISKTKEKQFNNKQNMKPYFFEEYAVL